MVQNGKLAFFTYATQDEVEAHNNLLDDMEEFGANCFNIFPSPWMDYKNRNDQDDEDEPFDEPSSVEAVIMCSGCPVVEGCFEYAKLYKPPHGVWGGIKWRNRKVSGGR